MKDPQQYQDRDWGRTEGNGLSQEQKRSFGFIFNIFFLKKTPKHLWSKRAKMLTFIKSGWRLCYYIILQYFYLYLNILIIKIIINRMHVNGKL